eukprot:SAG22_NODE_323_length_12378_cov_19.294975_4_plen_403_part_01
MADGDILGGGGVLSGGPATPGPAPVRNGGGAGAGGGGGHPPPGPTSPGRFVSGSLDDFEMLEKLGRGNCGTVYKVRRKCDDLFYVIKQIDIAALHPEELQQAIVEAQVLAALDNPYIIQYCDSFIDREMLNIVMELAEAGNLFDMYMRRIKAVEGTNKSPEQLSENAVWRYLLQILLGVQHAHSKHIVHRDLKTANIFLSVDDFIKIGDLGVARFMSTQTSMAETIVGTPFYMSPELFEEKPYTTKTDVWAIGCVLYEILTFVRPFEASNQAALMLKILRGKYDEQLLADRQYSPELAEIVSCCLTTEPHFRPSVEAILGRDIVVAKAAELQIMIPESLKIWPELEAQRKLALPKPEQFVKHFVGRDRLARPGQRGGGGGGEHGSGGAGGAGGGGGGGGAGGV